MDDTEFSRLLDEHMMGELSAEDRRRVVAAALESAERSIELAQVDEIRESLSDQTFRQSLIDELPDIEPVEQEAWWQKLLRPVYLVPLAGGAAAAVAILVLTQPGRRPDSAPTQVAEGPRTTTPSPTAPPLQAPGAGTPGRGAGGGRSIVTPLGTDVPATDLEPLFALAASRVVDLGLRVDGERFAPTATVTATLTLPADGHVSVVVRGPDGHFRELSLTAVPADVLMAGDHTFTFPAAGRLDPEQGGGSTLRVFFVAGTDVPPAGEARWRWLLERAGFDEVAYATAAQ
jgi:hypothetical protein